MQTSRSGWRCDEDRVRRRQQIHLIHLINLASNMKSYDYPFYINQYIEKKINFIETRLMHVRACVCCWWTSLHVPPAIDWGLPWVLWCSFLTWKCRIDQSTPPRQHNSCANGKLWKHNLAKHVIIVDLVAWDNASISKTKSAVWRTSCGASRWSTAWWSQALIWIWMMLSEA